MLSTGAPGEFGIGDGEVVAEELGHWIADNAKGGFRWHVSGDIVSVAHANWIGLVSYWVGEDVEQWIYTRSFDAVTRAHPLFWSTELVVNLSADVDNYRAAMELRSEVEGWGCRPPRICYLTLDGRFPDDLPDGSVIFPAYELRGDQQWWDAIGRRARRMVCPPDFFGQSPSLRCGPCQKCMRS